MRFLVATEQRTFFRKNGHVEFEAVFSENELSFLKKLGEERNVMHLVPEAKKLALHPKLATIVEQLIGKHTFRYGLDQLYCLPSTSFSSGTLKENFSIQGLAIGIMICVDGVSGLEPNSVVASPLFPQAPGNVIFFSPEFV